MLLPLTTKSNNFKQLVFTGPPAVMETILLMLNTPLNSSQEDPEYGFDINDFLFRVPDSETSAELEAEFNEKIKRYTNKSDIKATFSRENKGKTVVINITTEDEYGVINIPISITNKGEVEIINKITLE